MNNALVCELCMGDGRIGGQADGHFCDEPCPDCGGSGALTPAEPTYGGYVHTTSYKLMRLRMLLTGTNAPTDEAWNLGLSRLLDHLTHHPLTEA